MEYSKIRISLHLIIEEHRSVLAQAIISAVGSLPCPCRLSVLPSCQHRGPRRAQGAHTFTGLHDAGSVLLSFHSSSF